MSNGRDWRHAALGLIVGLCLGIALVRFLTPGPTQIDLTKVPLPARIERLCQVASARTAVIVVHGQSNAANYGNTRYVAQGSVDNFDPSSGKCFAAADPLLGTDGFGGNFATRLGDLLIQAKRYDRVIIVALAVEGASLAVLENEQSHRITEAISRMQAADLTPTHILFQQGEKDAVLTTSTDDYVTRLHRLVARFRAAGFDAPFYVSRSTKCDIAEPTNRAAIRAGQLAAVSGQLNVRLGPDTDMIGNDGRNPFDGCHMNELGTIANAALWATYLQ